MKNKSFFSLISAALLVFSMAALSSCNEDILLTENIRDQIGAPVITDFNPKEGEPGTEVIITGENLSNVTKVTIGDSVSEVLYRYSNTAISVKITGYEKSGKIKLFSNKGEGSSSADFTIHFLVPSYSNISPALDKITADTELTFTGENLQVVKSVFFGNKEGKITDQSPSRLVVITPYFEDDNASIKLNYIMAGQEQKIETPEVPVTNPVLVPTFDPIADVQAPSRLLTINGTYLNRITEVKFKDSVWTILEQSATQLKVQINAMPAGVPEMTGDLVFTHNKGQKLTAVSQMVLTDGPILNYRLHENITLHVNFGTVVSASGKVNDVQAFFNANTGEVYSACEYDNIRENITFFLSTTSNGVQLNNPASSIGQIKNFKCEGSGLPADYGVQATRFALLTDTAAAELALKTAVINKSITELDSVTTLADLSDSRKYPGTSSPRLDNATSSPLWGQGDVLIFRSYSGATNGAGGTPGKFGFIYIKEVKDEHPTEPGKINNNYVSITCDVYYQK